MSTSPYPVRLAGGDDLGRSRLTVFFRIFLVIPHVIVLWFFGVAALVAVVISWFAAIFTGRVPEEMHGWIVNFLRYQTRLTAYGSILADPFPPFGAGGTYPVDLEVDPPAPQNRLTVFFRYLLAIPCVLVLYVLEPVLVVVAIGCWFVALFTGQVPEGLQKLGLFCMRFLFRTHAYIFLVNPRYPAFGDTPGSLPADQGSLPPIP